MSSQEELKRILGNLEIPLEQAAIYLKLLELGEANYSELAKNTEIKRTTLYLIVDKMEKRGLVSRRVDRKTIQPIPPAQLFEMLQNNNLAFYHSLNLFQELMKRPASLTKVRFYNGLKGIQELLLDELATYKKEKQTLLRVIGSANVLTVDPVFFRQYQQRRKELGVKTKLLAYEDVKPYGRGYGMLNVDIKYLPSGTSLFRGRVSCTSRRATLINLHNEQNGIIIESRGLAETFIQWFDVTWSMLK